MVSLDSISKWREVSLLDAAPLAWSRKSLCLSVLSEPFIYALVRDLILQDML